MINNIDSVELGQILVKWISSSIVKSRNLNENDLGTIETIVSVICTHLIEAGVMKQIVDSNEEILDVFCVSISIKFVSILFTKTIVFLSFQPNRMYQWTHNDDHENRPKKSINHIYQNGDNNKNHNENDKSLKAIKSKLLACDSITSFYTELKSAINEIEDHANENELHRNCGPLISLDCVDHEDIRINTECRTCRTNQTSCDIKSEQSFVDKDTQTENSIETKVQPAATIPIPPPMPNFFTSPIPTITINQTVEKENVPVQIKTPMSVPPPPPPMPMFSNGNSPPTILSSASSFCPPPPPPMPMNGIPPPLPMPSGNAWFKSESKLKIQSSQFHFFTKIFFSPLTQHFGKQQNTQRNQ